MSGKNIEIKYVAEPTAALFHADDESFVRGVMGPIGSGKSVAMCQEIFKRSLLQEADSSGKRRTRWAIVRNTYPELKTTTIKTWQDWFPDSLCKMLWSTPITGKIEGLKLPDDTEVWAEFIFLSLDKPKDVKKLKSLELTGAFLNEAGELSKANLDMVTGRVDRYPPKMSGVGATWSGVIMDTNPPDDDSWWYELAEQRKPKGYSFWKQPGALLRIDDTHYEANPLAENVENHNNGYGYWLNQVAGKDQEWINVFILGQYGTVYDGKPVYDGVFNPDMHVSPTPIDIYRGLPVFIGWDYGLTPACVAGQITPKGQLLVLREWTCEKGGIRQFATEVIKPALANDFPGQQIISVGDPAGKQASQADENTCFKELARVGMPTKEASTNLFVPRREAVLAYLNKHIDGEAGFLLDPSCRTLIKGFNGGYKFNRVQISGEDRFKDTPTKNRFSHAHDALQYMALEIDDVGFRVNDNTPVPEQVNSWKAMT